MLKLDLLFYAKILQIIREICKIVICYQTLIAGYEFLPIDSQCELHNIVTFLRL